ncbi:MAG TPA: hypothetical protein VGH66_12565 [Acidimicrobiales bacterium]|jgi:hypothetical protein
MKRVVAFVPDLMDRSRISVSASSASVSLEFVGRPEALAEAAAGADLVLVDLARPGVLDVLASIGATTVGFASHVDRALFVAAGAAGCDEILARSVFFARLPRLLG